MFFRATNMPSEPVSVQKQLQKCMKKQYIVTKMGIQFKRPKVQQTNS